MLDWKTCIDCGDDVPSERYQAFCIFCERDREHSAQTERMGWDVDRYQEQMKRDDRDEQLRDQARFERDSRMSMYF